MKYNFKNYFLKQLIFFSIFNLVNDLVIVIYNTLLHIYPLNATFF